jgi:hypothetical protein
MKNLTIYRIFSYILITIAVMLGIATIFALVIALANPALFISVFVSAAVVLYSVSSFLFLVNGIDGKRKQKQGLKDFIKVNAYVAIVFAVLNIFQAVNVIGNPSVMNEAVEQLSKMQGTAKQLPAGVLIKMMKAVIWFLLLYAFILLVHIQMSFGLLKKHQHLFKEGSDTDDFHPTRIN